MQDYIHTELEECFPFDPPVVPQPISIIATEYKNKMLTDIVFILKLPQGIKVEIMEGVLWYDAKKTIELYKLSYNL